MHGPVAGLRVIDCSRGTAGPRATGMLADYGADVVWVEPPGGDPLRRCAPEHASVLNRGKRSVELDLHDPAARDRVLALVDRAEVFVESWRPGVADRLGLGYEALHDTQPRPGLRLDLRLRGGFRPPTSPATSRSCRPCSAEWPTRPAHRDGPVYPGFPFAGIGAASLAVLGALAALRRVARGRLAAATSRPRCSTVRWPTTPCSGARATPRSRQARRAATRCSRPRPRAW